MTLKIDVSQLADIAKQNDVAGAEDSIEAIEKAVDTLASKVAEHFKIQSFSSEHQPVEFGGLLVAFGPAFEGQNCPDPISEADPSGDWE